MNALAGPLAPLLRPFCGSAVGWSHLGATPTQHQLYGLVAASGGSIPWGMYMQHCLFGGDGYYSAGKALLGVDFTTSPETSPAFGACLAEMVQRVWVEMGRPGLFPVIELGAGSGALVTSFLGHAQALDPAFGTALRYVISEVGSLITTQRARVASVTSRDGTPVTRWTQASAIDFPFAHLQGVVMSNEVPDAFPVEIVTRRRGRVRQMHMAFNRKGILVPVWVDPSPEVVAYLTRYGIAVQEGVQEPLNLNAAAFAANVCRAIDRGVFLTVDYGGMGPVGCRGSQAVRAFSGRRYGATSLANAYRHPGDTDLTASVNFEPVETAGRARGFRSVYSGSQGDFLLRCGLERIADALPRKERTAAWELADTRGLGGYHVQLLAKGLPGLEVGPAVGPEPAVAGL